jgi:hypothetical protein
LNSWPQKQLLVTSAKIHDFMKPRLALFVSLIVCFLSMPAARADGDFDEGYRFIFYAVLEGCYEDGLETNDVSQILLANTNGHVHFVYACPLCTPTIHALEAYQSRPSHFSSLKTHVTTFGAGLSPDLKKQLHGEKAEDRLAAINALVNGWVSRRMKLLKLSAAEQTQLHALLEKKRRQGMNYLKSFDGAASVSAFTNVHQCAVCNGACGLNLKAELIK